MKKRRASTRGFSLSETLIGILIVALSSSLLVTMMLSTRSINDKTNQAATRFQEELNAVEIGSATADKKSGTVTINGVTVPVTFYEQGGLTAYRGE